MWLVQLSSQAPGGDTQRQPKCEKNFAACTYPSTIAIMTPPRRIQE